MNLLPLIAQIQLIAEIQTVPRMYYILPLIVAVSFVYGATRHERLGPILGHSLRTAIWVTTFLGIILALIWLGGYWN